VVREGKGGREESRKEVREMEQRETGNGTQKGWVGFCPLAKNRAVGRP